MKILKRASAIDWDSNILIVLLVLLDIFLIGANFYVGNRTFSVLLSVVLVLAVMAWRRADG